MIDQEVTAKLIPKYKRSKEVIKFKNDSLKLASNKERAETLSLLKNSSIITPNEAREFYGLPKLDGADELQDNLEIQSNDQAAPKDPTIDNNPDASDPKTDASIADNKTQTA
jgi:hypothetical protein